MKKITRMKNSLAAQQNLFLHLLPNQRSFYLFLSLPTPFISLLLPSPSCSSGREPGTGPRVAPSPDCTDCVSSDWPIRGLFLLQLVVFLVVMSLVVSGCWYLVGLLTYSRVISDHFVWKPFWRHHGNRRKHE